jgi:putative ATP-dependent endonuclease of OLD family
LLGEGETEAILFAGAANVLGVDLEQAGVRCVEYRQGDISYFLDAANSLGIAWHVFTDADDEGTATAKKAKKRLPADGKHGNWHLTKIEGASSVEPYLAANGFLEIYEQRASAQKKNNLLKAKKGESEYIEQIAKCLNDDGKPAAAHAVVAEMRRLGRSSIPKQLRLAIYKAAALGRRY